MVMQSHTSQPPCSHEKQKGVNIWGLLFGLQDTHGPGFTSCHLSLSLQIWVKRPVFNDWWYRRGLQRNHSDRPSWLINIYNIFRYTLWHRASLLHMAVVFSIIISVCGTPQWQVTRPASAKQVWVFFEDMSPMLAHFHLEFAATETLWRKLHYLFYSAMKVIP